MANQIPEILPWHAQAWGVLQKNAVRMPHALMFSGSLGIGKMHFAFRLAARLLCERADGEPCGRCMNCSLFTGSNHPDFHLIVSEAMLTHMDSAMQAYAERFLDDSKTRAKRKTVRSIILIDQIRALIEQAYSNSHISRNKVFVIAPAEAMNTNASNSLLKILEEPAENNYLLLVSHNSQNLLPTIVSRCQRVRLRSPTRQEATDWLATQHVPSAAAEAILASGCAPLAGIRQLGDKVLLESRQFISNVVSMMAGKSDSNALEIASEGLKLGDSECLAALQRLIYEIISCRCNASFFAQATQHSETIAALSRQLDPRRVYEIYDHIGTLRWSLKDGALNKQLALEDVILRIEGLAKEQSHIPYPT